MALIEDEISLIYEVEIPSEKNENSYRSISNHDGHLECPPQTDGVEQIFKLSRSRWLILLAVFAFGISNGTTDMLAPILNVLLDLLSLDLEQYIWVTSACLYLPVIITLPTAWIVDKWGLKFGIYAGLVITILRNGSRALLFSPNLPLWVHLRYVYWVSTNILTIQSATMYFCLPLKVSETWFSEKERFTAWSIMITGNEIGTAISAYLVPIYIKNVHSTYLLAYVNIVAALVLCLIVIICVRESKPPTPPSHRLIKSDNGKIPYFTSIKMLLTNRDYMVHLLYQSIDSALKISIVSIIQNILKNSGYDNNFCGQLLSIVSIAGVGFLFISSYSVLIVKNSPLGCKLLACLSTIGFLLYLIIIQLPDQKVLLLSAALLSSFFTNLAAPSFQNMFAHLCNGVVHQATISGLCLTFTCVLFSIYSLLVVYLRKQIDEDKFSYTGSMKLLSVSAVSVTLFYVLFFRGRPLKNNSLEQRES